MSSLIFQFFQNSFELYFIPTNVTMQTENFKHMSKVELLREDTEPTYEIKGPILYTKQTLPGI